MMTVGDWTTCLKFAQERCCVVAVVVVEADAAAAGVPRDPVAYHKSLRE